MSVAADYRIIAQNLDRSLALTARQAPVRLESEHYLANYRSIRSIDEFLADTRVFTFAMKAYGLGDLAHAKGYMRKVLEDGVADRDALANRTSDARIRQFAAAFDFETFGPDTMQRASMGRPVVDRYVRETLEVQSGEKNEGVRLALYFERQIGAIRTPYQILGDAALSQVVRTVLGLPDEFAAADIDKQAAVIARRVDIAELHTPAGVDRFLTRFTALWDASQGSADPVLSLFGVGAASSPTVSLELALSMQTLRLGGF